MSERLQDAIDYAYKRLFWQREDLQERIEDARRSIPIMAAELARIESAMNLLDDIREVR